MKKIINKVKSLFHGDREAGMATAEYAVGTVAVVGLGGVLWRILSSDGFRDAIWNLVLWLFKLITGIAG